ncbi:MAG: TOBE domain-containing protein [Halanaeroarchaeum sp.]
MDAGFEARLRAGDVSFTERDARLLRAIDEAGSLLAAAEDLERSYSRSHERVTELEEAFGPLVARERGGSGGGGSALTERAAEVLAAFARLCTGYTAIAETTEAVLDGTVRERDGELGVVETGAGAVRAIVPPEAERVQVALRADAVTLHAPADAPPESGTSARNRFEGTVAAIDRGESISRVTVDVGADAPIFALVTEASRETLALEPGRDVVATFKATATRATPAA